MDGNDYIDAHIDAPTGLDKIGIVSISYGDQGKSRIRDKNIKKSFMKRKLRILAYFLWGKFQELYTHEIPKQTVPSQGYLENISNFKGIVCKSNFSSIYTDINPSFNFKMFVENEI